MRRAEANRALPADDPYLTPAALTQMEAELERLEKSERRAAAEEVARTGAMGDLSENAAYQVAKQRLRGINTLILVLQERLKRAVPITKSDKDFGFIRIGSTLTLRQANGTERTYTILGSLETNPAQGFISHASPLGKALIGHTVGETVRVETPGGEVTYVIVALH